MILEVNIKSVEVLKIELKEKRTQYYKEFKKKHPNYYKEKSAKSKLENFERALLYQTRGLAKRRKLEFTLIIEDIVIPKFCPLTNTEITKSVGEGRLFSNPYIYRKDESIGYVKENILITCVLANHLRICASKEQIITFAKNIMNAYG